MCTFTDRVERHLRLRLDDCFCDLRRYHRENPGSTYIANSCQKLPLDIYYKDMLNSIYHRSNSIFYIHDTIFATIKAFLFLMDAKCCKECHFAKNLLLRHLYCSPDKNECEKTVKEIVDHVQASGDPNWAVFLLTNCYAKLNKEQCEQIIAKVKSMNEDQREQIIGKIVDDVLRGDLLPEKTPWCASY
jgi:hypothetical protein